MLVTDITFISILVIVLMDSIT